MNFKNLSLKIRTRLARAIVFASVVLPLTMIGTSPVNGQSPTWNITVVDHVDLAPTAKAIALNNFGEILLYSFPDERLAVYSPSVGVRFVDEMLSPEDAALWSIYHYSGGDINDAGHVIASGKRRDEMGVPTGYRHAVRVTLPAAVGQYAIVEDLGVAVGVNTSDASALNSFGDIGGTSQQAFLWSQSDGMAMLPVPVGTYSSVQGMNDDGELVGSYMVTNMPRALYWAAPDTAPIVIPVIANGRYGPSNNASAVDSRGLVVGSSTAGKSGPASINRAFSYDTATGQLKNLGSFGGDSWASSINEIGYIVGTAKTKNNAATKVFYYTSAAGMKDLQLAINNLPSGVSLTGGSVDINQFNDISLNVTLSDGRIRPALLRPWLP